MVNDTKHFCDDLSIQRETTRWSNRIGWFFDVQRSGSHRIAVVFVGYAGRKQMRQMQLHNSRSLSYKNMISLRSKSVASLEFTKT